MFKVAKQSLVKALQTICQDIVSAYESRPKLMSLTLISLAAVTGMLT